MNDAFWEGFQKEAAISDEHLMLGGAMIGAAGLGVGMNRLTTYLRDSPLHAVEEQQLAQLSKGVDPGAQRKVKSNFVKQRKDEIENLRWVNNIHGAVLGGLMGATLAGASRGVL